MRLFIFLIAILLAGSATGQSREKRDVGNFHTIAFRLPGKIFLKPGSSSTVEISATAEQLKRIETKVSDGKLIIQPESVRDWKNKGDFDNIRIYITMNQLNGINVDGSGHVRSDESFKCIDLDLDVAGSGTINLKGTAESLDVDLAGSGTIEFSGSVSGLKANISGSGSVTVKDIQSGAVDGKISGSGDLNVSGKAQEFRTVVAGSGNVKAFDLAATSVKVKVAGSGNVFVTSSESLDVDIAGSGSVQYKGSPAKVNTRSGGRGKVTKAEN